MQSDLFDKKVKDAADHHYPAYDEHAWKGMLKLLDKHLPQRPENRRRFLFILLFLFLGGGGWLMISQPWKNNNSVNRTSTEAEISTPENQQENKPEAALPDPAEKTDRSTENDLVSNADRVSSNERREPFTVAIRNRAVKTTEPAITAVDPLNNELAVKTKEPSKNETASVIFSPANINEPVSQNKDGMVVTGPVIENKTIKQDDKIDVPVTSALKTGKSNKDKSRKASPFFLSISAGPDISFAGISEWGNTRLLVGAGAGYTFRERFTVRTGFYSSRKIYSASPDEYNPPAEFWNYYPYLEKVDANCKVYEIPLTLSYNFSRSPKKEWFVSAGVSTYLMKEENYNYYFKYTPTGPTFNRMMNYENKNQHFLSVLTLSGGYKRNLSKRVFVSAEPFLKLPLDGIGYGKVKLNSGGVLLTLGVRPFNARNTAPVQR